MKTTTMKTKHILIISILALSGIPAMAATYDLAADWSDINNPNGVWSLTEGTTILPSNFGWVAGGIPPTQHIWGFPASSSPVTHPIWFKAATAYSDSITQIAIGNVIT